MADARPDFDDGANILTDGVVVVSTTATPLRIAAQLDISAEYIIIENRGSIGETIFLGSSSVTFGNGLRLRPNQKATLSCKRGAPWYAITDSGTVNIYVVEMGC